MDTQRLYQLLEAYAARAASPEEEQELFGLLDAGPEPDIKAVLSQLQQAMAPDPAAALDTARWQPVLDRILATARTLESEEGQGTERNVRRLFPWTRVAAAAAVIGLLIGGTWLWIRQRPATSISTQPPAAKPADIAPGGNHAVLTLACGSTIVLDNARNGQLASQGNTTIVKSGSGQLAYNAVQGQQAAIAFNTLTTPRGGVYQLILPDGTKVWLNAASSITYPTAFVGRQRLVKMSGEAYFEVSKDPGKPFHVQIEPDAEVQVLGTNFNINAYADEPVMATTLVSGSIRVSEGGTGGTPPGTSPPKGAAVASPTSLSREAEKLSPGQQAIVQEGKPIKVVKDADINRVMAWRNGQFPLQGTDLGALMRQIARWYDVDVHVNGILPQKTFGGSISRTVNLSAVLEALRENGVDCRLNGKTIEVTNDKPDP